MYNEESVEWLRLSDKDKVGYVIHRVLKCPYFLSWDDVIQEKLYHVPRYPLAFLWNNPETWYVQQYANDNAEIFDPLHNMSDAWQVWESMKKQNWRDFCYELDGVVTGHKRGWNEATGECYVTWFEQFLEKMNTEAICIAALLTCGVEVKR